MEIRSEVEKLISCVNITYSMATTISLSQETKDKLKNLGRAGDSYEDVIKKMYDITKKHLLHEWLYDETDTVTAKEALAEAKRKWPE